MDMAVPRQCVTPRQPSKGGILFETQRAASGGTLTARELWVERIWLVRGSCLYIALWRRGSVAVHPAGAFCPVRSVAREASTLSLVTCYSGFSRHGIDPVGETSNVPDNPLGSWRPVVSPSASANRRHPW